MAVVKQFLKGRSPVIIGIAGGSASGKTWLAKALLDYFNKEATILSLDDFYRDRSHLSSAVRARINFDHPRSIDWEEFEKCLKAVAHGREAVLPSYDFATHCRTPSKKRIAPKPIVIVEGLWTYRKASVRNLFSYRIFVDCPTDLRLERRLKRDCQERGRSEDSARQQFQTFVEPMHQRFVAPQRRWASTVFSDVLTVHDVEDLAQQIKPTQSKKKL